MKTFYLKKAHLKGYKSIKDVEIELNDGLNILIGKNASGKTNFLTFLDRILSGSFKGLSNFQSDLSFSNDLRIETNKFFNLKNLEPNNLRENLLSDISIKLNQNEIEPNDLWNKLYNQGILRRSYIIGYGIPKDLPIVEKPYSFSIDSEGNSFELETSIKKFESEFLNGVIIDLYFGIKSNAGKLNEETLKNEFVSASKRLLITINNITRYSPIKDVRFSDNYNIFTNDKENIFTVNNIFFEYKVNDSWYPYSGLSDGTKRLLFIISELSNPNHLSYYLENKISVNTLIFIEEPELGIHPHQLMDLMNFIKEMSKDKQIIITTHSPLVLDILEKDELDRIIIASTSNDGKGTKLRHLNTAEVEKAQKYMEEDYLSDYWKHSDLEN